MSTPFESFRFLRVPYSAQETANRFAEYCRRNQVITRGLCRIGYIQRCPPVPQLSHESVVAAEAAGATAGSTPLPMLRGLIANKSIPKDTNVVMLPLSACIGPSNAMKCTPFFDIFPREAREAYFLQMASVQNSRVAEQSLIRHNQLLLALYMAYLLLVRALQPDAQGSDPVRYLDFLPRSEGNFAQLEAHMAVSLETAEACRVGQTCLAAHFRIPQAEIRPLLVWALCMIYSRMVPIDHKGLLEEAFRDTPVASFFASQSRGEDLMPEPISFLCPIVDMCNHSEGENVAVMVPDNPPSRLQRVVCLRTLRDVAEGEELVMTYSRSPAELRTIWGMSQVLL
ncbi:unnamed protein product [Phytomonas sp. EM1]|nr:unnamed protein product [Phytomonas sp. EM1]|eukprot:CCW63758.1 unnamed protein product [Phytomonas sp. isolate EM1]